MSGSIVWVHEDALRDDHPAYERAPKDARRVFIWDAGDFEARAYSLKRLVFLHECLRDMNVEIMVGETQTILRALKPDTVFMAESPDPFRRKIAERLSEHMSIERADDQPLADIPDDTDMGRFFRFWNKARRSVLSQSSEFPNR